MSPAIRSCIGSNNDSNISCTQVHITPCHQLHCPACTTYHIFTVVWSHDQTCLLDCMNEPRGHVRGDLGLLV